MCRDFEVRKDVPIDVVKGKRIMKEKCYVFAGYKQRNNVWLIYLECKLQQDRYGWRIFKLKLQKTAERRYLERTKS